METPMAKGTFYHLLARILFVLSSFGVNILAARFLGAADYGIVGVILSLVVVVRTPLIRGFSQAVSTFTAAHPREVLSIRNIGFKFQCAFSIPLFFIFFLFAPLIANSLSSPEITPYIRIASPLIPLMAIYSVYLSSLNGQRFFAKEALTIAIYSFIRFFSVAIFLIAGFKIKGVVGGLLLAPLVALFFAKYLNTTKTNQSGVSGKSLVKFAAPVVAFSVLLGLLMNMDLLFVKSLLKDYALSGYYAAAVTITRAPHFLSYALLFTLLPSVSKAFANNQPELIRTHIRKALRYSMLVLIPMATIIAATSRDLIILLYSTRYIDAAVPLRYLIWGVSLLTIFLILTTIITGTGRPHIALIMIASVIPVDILFNLVLIPAYGLLGAASATTLTCLIACLTALTYIHTNFNVAFPFLSLLKISVSSVILWGINLLLPLGGFALILKYCFLFAIYFIALYLLKELNEEDFLLAKQIGLRTKSKI